MTSEAVRIPAGDAGLAGDLVVPGPVRSVVLFAHGSGSSRLSPRNRAVATALQRSGLATLLMDLLTEQEEEVDALTAGHRFDIGLLSGRLTAAIGWLGRYPATTGLAVHLFGASTGAAAALTAAAQQPDEVQSVVSRGGRPDLADDALDRVRAPVLLIVGGEDREVLRLNHAAADRLRAPHEVHVVPGATHLFEEPGALEEVAEVACRWFLRPPQPPGEA
ncbi:dienelactone hydrolase family protein [Streptomyces sp. URMC 127]|uniref:dienelactone hydrolase family protein n=1 Tax=Streptomyces sp. URMC 127 TaxID=3423402 RepID=UPI003F192E36